MDSRKWFGIAVACLWSALGFEGRAASPQELDATPLTVYVSVGRAQLFSGPSSDFYPTGYVPQGTALEVYHHTNDNWLGVRPPQGCFSWLPATDAYLLPGGKIVEVINSAAVSWIGTSLGSAKQYRWQVKLKAGEQLSVIGEQTTRDADGKEVLWYRISPPAGEFRWIAAKEVSSHPVTKHGKSASQLSASPPSKPADVVTAAYQTAGPPQVIALGEAGDYYPDDQYSSDATTVDSDGATMHEGAIVLDGPTHDGYANGEQYYEGEVIVGDSYDESAIDGEVVVDDGYYPGEIIQGGSYFDDASEEVIYDSDASLADIGSYGPSGTFDGWHAMDLTDDGMRFTWLERMYGKAKQVGPDPLAADPFSLAMHRGNVRPNSPRAIEQMYPEEIPTHGGTSVAAAGSQLGSRLGSQHRPWRDPRTLGADRATDGGGVPLSAPDLSLRSPQAADESAPIDRTAPLTAGLQRVNAALQTASHKLAGTSPSNVGAGQVNWYGIGNPTSPGNTVAGNSATGNSATTGGTSPTGASGIPATLVSATTSSIDLNQLQVRLSEAVTQPMQLWSLQPIYDAARQVVEHGSSPVERGQARLLMERVEEFAELAARSGYLALDRNSLGQRSWGSGISPSGPAVMLASATSGSLPSAVPASFQNPLTNTANYDATGWLVPVIAASSGQPTHALTDDTGRILSYVTSVPGLNLDRYVNQAVGVTGLRGYLPQLQAGHIQAGRIVRIQ